MVAIVLADLSYQFSGMFGFIELREAQMHSSCIYLAAPVIRIVHSNYMSSVVHPLHPKPNVVDLFVSILTLNLSMFLNQVCYVRSDSASKQVP